MYGQGPPYALFVVRNAFMVSLGHFVHDPAGPGTSCGLLMGRERREQQAVLRSVL